MRTTIGRLPTFSELRFTHQRNEATSTSLRGKTGSVGYGMKWHWQQLLLWTMAVPFSAHCPASFSAEKETGLKMLLKGPQLWHSGAGDFMPSAWPPGSAGWARLCYRNKEPQVSGPSTTKVYFSLCPCPTPDIMVTSTTPKESERDRVSHTLALRASAGSDGSHPIDKVTGPLLTCRYGRTCA